MLKRVFLASVIIFLLSSLGFGFQEGTSWPKFDSPEGRFSVVMPVKPQPEVKDVDTSVGKLALYTYACSNNIGHYMVSFADYPTEPTDATQREKVLDGVRGGVLNGLGAEWVSETKIVLNRTNKDLRGSTFVVAYPGREFKAKKTVEGSEVVFSWKMYLVGRRLYQLAVATAKADAESPDIQKFLSSFQLSN